MIRSTWQKARHYFTLRRFVGQFGLAVILLSVAVVGDYLLNAEYAKRRHQEVLREFQSVRPLPTAVPKSTSDNYSLWRKHQGTVAAFYGTRDDYRVIRQHYDRELLSYGWRLVVDRPAISWGKETDAREVLYCKQPLYASLYYAGPPTETKYPGGWTYEFSVSWGDRPADLKDECPDIK
ncbi:MAG: hypothetical protein WA188_20780 [Terriglobales bacterium]